MFKDSENKIYKSYKLSFSGAMVYTAGKLGSSRPVIDSFALIQTGIENIKVNLNGEILGKTNEKGYVFLSELSSYYDNIISIDDKDIPFEYNIYTKEVAVSPWYRSGFCLVLPIERGYRYTGFLKGKIGENLVPLEFSEITIETHVKEQEDRDGCIKLIKKEFTRYVKIETARKGEFYIENLTPGFYKAKTVYKEEPVEFQIILPDKKEPVIELGDIVISLPFSTQRK